MQIIIPAAGLGKRFSSSPFNVPKPIISWAGKPMLTHVIDNFLDDNVTIFIVKQKNVDFVYNHSRVKITDIDYVTDGPATTASLVNIDKEKPLIITNCDQIIKDWNYKNFNSFCANYDAVLGCFFSFKQHNSYVQINDDLLVTNVKEKEVISNIATNGLHYWKKAKYFLDSYSEMKQNKDSYKNEYYVAPTYNYLIKKNYKVGVYMFNQHFPVGTPEDLQRYLADEN